MATIFTPNVRENCDVIIPVNGGVPNLPCISSGGIGSPVLFNASLYVFVIVTFINDTISNVQQCSEIEDEETGTNYVTCLVTLNSGLQLRVVNIDADTFVNILFASV
jgi:hypothetical protein